MQFVLYFHWDIIPMEIEVRHISAIYRVRNQHTLLTVTWLPPGSQSTPPDHPRPAAPTQCLLLFGTWALTWCWPGAESYLLLRLWNRQVRLIHFFLLIDIWNTLQFSKHSPFQVWQESKILKTNGYKMFQGCERGDKIIWTIHLCKFVFYIK